MELPSGETTFTTGDLEALSDLVGRTWTATADLDWSVPAGDLTWSCLHTADHAVDCVYAPAFFLASRRADRYPEPGDDMTLGARARPALLVESLAIATRFVVGVVEITEPDVRSIIVSGGQPVVAPPRDFVPRAALELALHAHDVATGLDVPFEPPADLSLRLREHTRPWPMWERVWGVLPETDDPWGDLLTGSGRTRPP